jgi:hypothetical protein
VVGVGSVAAVSVVVGAFIGLRPDACVTQPTRTPTALLAHPEATAAEPVMSTEAAITAAVRYVASTGELFAHSPVGRREILRKLVTPDALGGQAAALDDTATAMSDKLPHPVEEYVWVEAPLTAGIEGNESTSAESVTVAVWTVAVLAHPSGGLVEQVWRTVHVSLQASDNRWLVSQAWTDSGPTPTANELALPSSVDEYLDVARLAPVVPHEEL